MLPITNCWLKENERKLDKEENKRERNIERERPGENVCGGFGLGITICDFCFGETLA